MPARAAAAGGILGGAHRGEHGMGGVVNPAAAEKTLRIDDDASAQGELHVQSITPEGPGPMSGLLRESVTWVTSVVLS